MLCGRLYAKGAAELLLQQCSARLVDGGSAERLSQREKDDILRSFAADGKRCAAAHALHLVTLQVHQRGPVRMLKLCSSVRAVRLHALKCKCGLCGPMTGG